MVLKIEGDEVTAVETATALSTLEDTLKMRKEDRFLSPTVSEEKNALIESGFDSEKLNDICEKFYGMS